MNYCFKLATRDNDAAADVISRLVFLSKSSNKNSFDFSGFFDPKSWKKCWNLSFPDFSPGF